MGRQIAEAMLRDHFGARRAERQKAATGIGLPGFANR